MARTAVGAAVLAVCALVLSLTGCNTGERVDLGDGAGGALIAAIAGEPDQLDPHKTTAYFSFEVLENVFDTLVEPDQDLQMKPALAESWEVSPDQLTWTFRLRPGVTFHDGTPLAAEDVVFSYRRIIDEQLANSDKFSSVQAVEAPDPSTVVIRVDRPTPNMLTNLGGFKGMAIVSRANVESGRIATHPVGTGPFSFLGQKSGDSISLRANPDYWAGPPGVAGVTFRFIPEPSTALSALQAGEVDWTDSVPPQRVSQLRDDESLQLTVTPSNDYWYLALNQARAPWNDVRVRQAIAYAIDRDAIVQATSYGTAAANQLAIPEGNPWFTPYDRYREDGEEGLETARDLLRQANATPGDLDMLVTTEYPETVTAAQIVADNLAPLGITVNIRTVDFATWLDEQNSGNFDMLMMGWLGNIDPDDFYYAQHHTDGTSNAQKFSNPEVDRLLDAGRVETDEQTRKAGYARAATLIADEVSYIYLYNPSVIQAWNPALSGYEARRDGAVRFRSASLDSDGNV
ncbi:MULTISPECIES: ABC transporter substrate-binding protein [Mycolicibacterium]|uniref:ABC-type dipeptide transport system, periplasmic component n=3 Tax=Mycolicibacterium gilvum TaxID=1804 RepID=E6TFD5_MYCSR|nr:MULTISPECIES: ABC transporter substrate-binding protein [Mycolicibacterium]ABP45238.1 extracellular solute-binding protein, family 5 [Mycolicibacterium gilvum PYR-GCK]ADT98851.1 ABC-type dipeptide transport system, periplasmic component [Mycolicibacterium gilvum Spyr1]MBV5244482.1 ABC transporter substrate-binding protein [Mycolicibacterium sp. PAM1]MCV7057617.1 ABC transporter substrate-binding protein [Mycolicibacterium gilvum]STZ44447.1 extracellular solute-binding protein [Mycolicibacte